ncbi:MAG: hypothetical protein WB611_11385, partial [Stellaceae bacterium]
ALAGLVVYVAHRYVSRNATDTVWIAGIALTVLLSAMQIENFVSGFQAQFFAIELAAVAAIVCLVQRRRSSLSLVAATGFSALAVYTLASGIIVPFLAIPVALWAGRSKAQIILLSLSALALLVSYLHGYISPGYRLDPVRMLAQPDFFAFMAIELGNPFGLLFQEFGNTHYLYWAGGFGTLGLVLFATSALTHLCRGRSIGEPALLFLAVAAFAISVVFLTVLGRLVLGVGEALSTRYATPMLLFWLSLAMLALIEIRRRRRFWLLAMGLSLPCLLGLAYTQASFVNSGLASVLPRREGITALLADVDDPEALMHLYPVPARLIAQAVQLRARHQGIFADGWSTWLDTPLADHTRLAASAQCRGAIEQITALPASGRRQWRVSGWAWDNSRGVAPERIVLTDGPERIIGYALTGYAPYKPDGPKRSGWHGHLTADKTASITAYALIDRNRAACPLRALGGG